MENGIARENEMEEKGNSLRIDYWIPMFITTRESYKEICCTLDSLVRYSHRIAYTESKSN